MRSKMKSQLKSRLNLKSMIIARLGAVDGGRDSWTAQLPTYCISWKYRLRVEPKVTFNKYLGSSKN